MFLASRKSRDVPLDLQRSWNSEQELLCLEYGHIAWMKNVQEPAAKGANVIMSDDKGKHTGYQITAK